MINERVVVGYGGTMPAKTPLSETISSAVRKRGFQFVGPVVVYAWRQAVGTVNDHETHCFRRNVTTKRRRRMYYPIIRRCVQALKNLDTWLDKAEQHAAAKGFDVSILLTSRLAPDMRDFIYQVQSACDYTKGAAAWLSGQKPPRHEDNEQTIDEVRARIRKTVDFAESVKEAQYAGASERRISLSWGHGKMIGGEDYLLQVAVPDAHFHVSMAYAILRHNGVDIGKRDFRGPINWIDA